MNKDKDKIPIARDLYAAILVLANECNKHKNCDDCPLCVACIYTPYDMLSHFTLKK